MRTKDDSIRTCTVCGKVFDTTEGWLYKVIARAKGKTKTKYQCSYTCWRKAGGDKGYGIPYGKG